MKVKTALQGAGLILFGLFLLASPGIIGFSLAFGGGFLLLIIGTLWGTYGISTQEGATQQFCKWCKTGIEGTNGGFWSYLLGPGLCSSCRQKKRQRDIQRREDQQAAYERGRAEEQGRLDARRENQIQRRATREFLGPPRW